MEIEGNSIKGYQNTWGNTRVYIYLETDIIPSKSGILKDKKLNTAQTKTSGDNSCAVFCFDGQTQINARYGISFISIEQAKKNLQNEIPDFNFDKTKNNGRKIWNEALGKIEVKGGISSEE